MSEASILLQRLKELKAQMNEPVSYMSLIRQSVQPQISNYFNPTQKQVVNDNLDKLAGFLESEDGSDVLELFVITFAEYVERNKPVEQTW